jgi:hypothetical protein
MTSYCIPKLAVIMGVLEDRLSQQSLDLAILLDSRLSPSHSQRAILQRVSAKSFTTPTFTSRRASRSSAVTRCVSYLSRVGRTCGQDTVIERSPPRGLPFLSAVQGNYRRMQKNQDDVRLDVWRLLYIDSHRALGGK